LKEKGSHAKNKHSKAATVVLVSEKTFVEKEYQMVQ
jgi:predicted RNA binding protein YcfA (HicA-like mRNA interferase family)